VLQLKVKPWGFFFEGSDALPSGSQVTHLTGLDQALSQSTGPAQSAGWTFLLHVIESSILAHTERKQRNLPKGSIDMYA